MSGQPRPRGARPDEHIARRQRERVEAIEKLFAEAEAAGKHASRAFWAMVYDFELAPRTTNRAQLEAMGVSVPRPSDLTDADVTPRLWELLHVLARLRIYFLGTDHLSDRELYEHIVLDVLEEEVPDVIAHDDMQEWIDMSMHLPRSANDDCSVEIPMPAVIDRDLHLPRPPRRVEESSADPAPPVGPT